MAARTRLLRPILIGLLGIYLFIYPVSIVLVALDRVPVWGTWMGGALLILLGSLMGLWLTLNYGRRGGLAALLILLLSWSIEQIGATTGFPFGSYTYTDVLWPKIGGVVPLAIPFAWLLVVPAALGASELILKTTATNDRAPGNGVRILTAASFALLLDVTIEPFAVNINRYWIWDHVGGFYGIPASNFIAWWVMSLLFAWVLLSLIAPGQRAANSRRQSGDLAVADASSAFNRRPAIMMAWLPLALYLLNLTMFVVVNLARGQGAAAGIGGLILFYLALGAAEPLLVRWVLGRSQVEKHHTEIS